MSERTLQALRGRINARLQTSAISRDRASAAGREVVALCRQSDVETLEWVLSEIDAALRPEARGEGDAVRRAWELAVQRAYGCLDYCGGYRGAELEAFHSGIKTVIRALEAGLDTVDTQTAALDRIGAALRSEAQGEGWQVTEPAHDIVRREMPETRATVREAIRAARRGEGGGE